MQRRDGRAPGAVLADDLLAHNCAPVVGAGAARSARSHLHAPCMDLSIASCTGPRLFQLQLGNAKVCAHPATEGGARQAVTCLASCKGCWHRESCEE